MSFEDNVRHLQRMFKDAGYEIIRKPVDISALTKADKVIDCEIIARKDFFDIIYMEAESNWRSIASDVASKSKYPCMVITRYGDAHHIITTVKNHGTDNAKPRHVVLETGARPAVLCDFIRAVKVSPHDDHIAIDGRVQTAFDEFAEYKQAVDEFGNNLETIIKKTESAMNRAISGNKKYHVKAKRLLKMCKEVISAQIDMDDIRSMLLQHILTYRIFALVYDVSDFHETNVVAKSLDDLKRTLNIPHDKISYKTIELIAESVTDIDQRQEFLKKVYETFYEKYDPDRADKDGIVYTPSEVVNFMVKSADYLLEKHFEKLLSDDGVTILDPATGTGTFLVRIMRQIGKSKIRQKYSSDLHANEISILPYYIAALNIEHAYKEMTGEYKEFENICWMDTLDSGVKDYGKLTSHFGYDDNVKRMTRQQNASIRVTIGNPPYNAVQTSFNNANPADKYDHIDKKIQCSYYKTSSAANKNKSFDMYKRFLKWSSDRIDGNGMVVFISNNSFLDAKADDGIRRALYKEFDHIYVVNLKGNARLAGDAWRREGGKIFGGQARVGVCISFLLKTGKGNSDIRYAEVNEGATREEKLEWLDNNTIEKIKPQKIVPDEDAIWLNQTDNNFKELCPTLPGKFEESIFKEYTLGVATAKDDWVYDLDQTRLESKIKYYIQTYNCLLQKYKKADIAPKDLLVWVSKKIKWSPTTLNSFSKCQKLAYRQDRVTLTLYRPFVCRNQYYADHITERQRGFRQFFHKGQENVLIGFPNPKTNVKFDVIGTNLVTDLGCLDGIQNIPLWLYNDEGKQVYNITKFGIELFQKHYKDENIGEEDIFYYTYAVFNDPKYEETYRYDLRRQLPQIPMAQDFRKWSSLGKKLFKLHCDFTSAKKYNLQRVNKLATKNKVRLLFKNNKNIEIVIDDMTTLKGVPQDVLEWTFKSKTPLEWILDFYKEQKNYIKKESCDDENIRKRFTTYNFNDHKENAITLLMRVTTICIKTVKIRRKLKEMEWGPQPNLNLTLISNPKRSSRKHGCGKKKSLKSSRTTKKVGDQDGAQTRLPA